LGADVSFDGLAIDQLRRGDILNRDADRLVKGDLVGAASAGFAAGTV
jgi:hypothetical protein